MKTKTKSAATSPPKKASAKKAAAKKTPAKKAPAKKTPAKKAPSKKAAKRRVPRGAARVENAEKHSFGWLMRIKRGEKFVQEFFSDRAHGGKRASQRAAEARYAELAAKLPAPKSSAGQMSVRNRSGFVGVRLAQDSGRRAGDGDYSSWVAFWRENGGDRSIRFSCQKYGKKAAFALACLAREKKLANRDAVEKAYEKQKAKPKAGK